MSLQRIQTKLDLLRAGLAQQQEAQQATAQFEHDLSEARALRPNLEAQAMHDFWGRMYDKHGFPGKWGIDLPTPLDEEWRAQLRDMSRDELHRLKALYLAEKARLENAPE